MAKLSASNKYDESEFKTTELLKPWFEFTQSKGFLASEFLLWLWYFVESDQNPTNVSIDGKLLPVKLWIEDKIVLESSGGKAHIQTLKGGDPSGSIEAGSGLISGKTVRELKIGLHVDTYGEFTVLLSSKDLSPKTIQLPSPESSPTTLAHRLKMLDLIIELIDHFFLLFVDLRVRDTWTTVTFPKIENWIETRGHQESHLH